MLRFLLPLILLVPACTDTVDDDDSATAGDDDDTAEAPCHSVPQPADGPRKVVVAHPFTVSQTTWELLDLDASGVMTRMDTFFEMGRGPWGEVVFTPDGELGFAVQDDGTVGIFRITGDGVEVLDPGFGDGLFYAGSVVVEPDAQRVWVVDGNWRENGGGLYPFALSCDGELTPDGDVLPGKQPFGMRLRDGRGALYGRDLLDSSAGDNLHLVDLDGGELLSSVAVFPDDEAFASALAWSGDYVLVGDNSTFSGLPNRVGVARVEGDTLVPVQVLSDIEDPIALTDAGLGGPVLVASGFGDALLLLERTGDPTAPFVNSGELSYAGGHPQLPGGAVAIERGALAGMVFIPEVTGVRQVQLSAAGAVDLGVTSTGGGTDGNCGAIGVQP